MHRGGRIGVYIYTYIDIFINIYTCTHLHIYICIYVHIYIHVHEHVNIHTYTEDTSRTHFYSYMALSADSQGSFWQRAHTYRVFPNKDTAHRCRRAVHTVSLAHTYDLCLSHILAINMFIYTYMLSHIHTICLSHTSVSHTHMSLTHICLSLYSIHALCPFLTFDVKQT